MSPTPIPIPTLHTLTPLPTPILTPHDRCRYFYVPEAATTRLYAIQVDGYRGARGAVTIDVQASTSPYNDRFSEPQVITSITETGSTMWATLQTGEPSPVSISAGASGSIW
jgi:hypothetical protein